jgi:ABC-type multidrug transport system fused ATPase/permease subunit
MVQNLCFVASIVVLCLLSTAWFLVFLVPILLLFALIYYIFGKVRPLQTAGASRTTESLTRL